MNWKTTRYYRHCPNCQRSNHLDFLQHETYSVIEQLRECDQYRIAAEQEVDLLEEQLRAAKAENIQLKTALQECFVVIAGILHGTTWELSPRIKEQMIIAHDLAETALSETKGE